MAPKAAAAPVVTPSAGTGTASDESVSPPSPHYVHGRQQQFKQAIEEASVEDDVFPYGVQVPFKVRDAVPGNKMASAQVFLSEAPEQALKDMCLFLQLEEDGSIDDLVSRLLDYFTQMFPKAGSASSRNLVQEKLATGPTPARTRNSASNANKVLSAESSASDLRDRLTELGKPTYGTKDVLLKRLQEAAEAAEKAKQSAADAGKKKRTSKAPEVDQKDSKASLKKAKTTESLQDDYCVPGMSIEEQMEMALKMSIQG